MGAGARARLEKDAADAADADDGTQARTSVVARLKYAMSPGRRMPAATQGSVPLMPIPPLGVMATTHDRGTRRDSASIGLMTPTDDGFPFGRRVTSLPSG